MTLKMNDEIIQKKRGGSRQGAGRKPLSGRYKEKTIPVRIPLSQVNWVKQILLSDPNLEVSLKKFPSLIKNCTLSAGTPFELSNTEIEPLDLNTFLTANSPSCFYIQVSGDSMMDMGIYHDDYVVIDRGKKVCSNHIVMAKIEGYYTLKQIFFQANDDIILRAANPNVSDIKIKLKDDLEIVGVMIGLIRKYSY